jgi:spore maturation protein CgeB
LRQVLGAQQVAPLYGSVDPAQHLPRRASASFSADLSYLGTYAADRQHALGELLLTPAKRLPACRFAIAGAQYPEDFSWLPNVKFARHLPPADHSAFYCSSRLTLNITRAAMARMGHCPSARLFEAAACGVPVISDAWDGLEHFFNPKDEIFIAREAGDVIAALSASTATLTELGARARKRALAGHTAAHRAEELLELVGGG